MSNLSFTPKCYPDESNLSQNLDFSSFPYLVKRNYKCLLSINRRNTNMVPYCVFLHVCTGILNAVLLTRASLRNPNITLSQVESMGKYFRIFLPAPIVNYILNVANTKTVDGRNVEVHIPNIAIPHASGADEAGSFGALTASNHNVYECYVSPYVTRRYIEVTRDNEEFWHPLPPEMRPADGRPNHNFLGYDSIEPLNESQEQFLNGFTFFDSLHDEIDARLQWSDYLATAVHGNMQHLSSYYEMKTLAQSIEDEYDFRHRKTSDGMVAFLVSSPKNSRFDTHLAPLQCKIHSSEEFNAIGRDILCFGLKRKRTRQAPGLCYTMARNGREEAYEGWMDHINDNFFMRDEFKANEDENNSQLQCNLYWSFDESREAVVANYIQGFNKGYPYSVVYRRPDCHRSGTYLYQSMDFSHFPYLVKETYNRLKTWSGQSESIVPYCVFLHVCTGILNAVILARTRSQSSNGFRSFDIHKYLESNRLLPAPIIRYIRCIADTMMNDDIEVKIHIPDIAIPRASGNAEGVPAGSFGILNEFTHNVYECYVSPYVTRMYIEATRKGVPGEVWHPLPAEMEPNGATPNGNLLGYDTIETLTPTQRTFLDNFTFPDFGENTDDARLQWSQNLALYVQRSMDMVYRHYEMLSTDDAFQVAEIPYWKTMENMVGFIETVEQSWDIDSHIVRKECEIHSCQEFNKALGNTILGFGLKRRRNHSAPGLCYTVMNNGIKQAPDGWMDHINDNFFMVGRFEKREEQNSSLLQCSNYISQSAWSPVVLSQYLNCFIKEYDSDSD